jgi:ubiquitin-protein ligase E3 C
MLPLFGDDRRRREINLGGSTSVSSQAAILDQARARRMEREAQRKRGESAIRIQAWWRGACEARRVRQQLRRVFQEQVTGLTALRCLVLVGQDEELLSLWSERISQDDGRTIVILLWCGIFSSSSPTALLFGPVQGPDRDSWITLLRRVAVLLLRSISSRAG